MTQGMLQRGWYDLVRRSALFVLTACFGLRVLWRHRVPGEGGVLLVANHQSYLDPMIAVAGLRRMVSFMARSTLFQNRFFGRLIRSVNAFPIDREGRDTRAIREAIRRLREGGALLIFPEGTRTRDGSVGVLRGGMDIVARRARVPVVPVAIDGAFRVWPRHGRGLKLARLWVSYGRPIQPERVDRMSRDELQDLVRQEIVVLLADLHERQRRAAG